MKNLAFLSLLPLFAFALVAHAEDAPAPAEPAAEPAAAAEAPAPAEPAAEPAADAEKPAAEPAEPEAPSAAVTIDGEVAVTVEEIDAMILRMFAQNGDALPDLAQLAQARTFLRPQLAESLANKWLLLREARKRGLEVSDKDRADTLSSLPPEMRTLAAIAAKMGTDEATVRRELDESILCEKVVSAATNGIPAPSEAEVRERFDRIVAQSPAATNRPETVVASHILRLVPEDASSNEVAEVRAKIDEIRARVLAGEDFAALAGEFSEDPGSKEDGGRLPPFGRGEMVAEFEEAAFSQPTNEVGEVFRTSYGFHFVRVEEHEPAKSLAFEDVREDIANGMAVESAAKAVEKWIADLASAAKIVYADGFAKQDGGFLPFGGGMFPDDEDAGDGEKPAAGFDDEATDLED